MIAKVLAAVAGFVWFCTWRLERRARISDPIWSALELLNTCNRVIIYDPKGRRRATGYKHSDGTVVIKLS